MKYSIQWGGAEAWAADADRTKIAVLERKVARLKAAKKKSKT